MYDEDYENYKQQLLDELNDNGWTPTGRYVTKDSGKLFESPDGMVRDTSEGKPQFTLMFPKGIPFEDQLMTRVADLYHRGGVKYGPRNWEKSSTEEALAKHEDCLMRHVVKYLLGVDDGEDHAAAIVWNVNAVDLTRYKIALAEAEKSWPDGPSQPSIDEFERAEAVKAKTLPERIEELRALTPTVVEFAVGDELLDKNNNWWKFDGKFWGEEGSGTHLLWNTLVHNDAPLHIQTGAFAGLTILKDGSKRWG